MKVYSDLKVYSVLVAALLLASGCAHNEKKTTSAYHGTPSQYAATTSSHGAPAPAATATVATASTNDVAEIPLYREELKVTKRTVSGGVLLRKVVETETISQPLDLRREDIIIERLGPEAASAHFRDGATPFADKQVVIALMREVPNAEKSIQITEVIRASKTTEKKNITVPETIRHEEFNMDRSAPESVGGPATTTTASASASAPAERAQNDSAEISLHKEQLVGGIGKRQISNGQVTLRKQVITENVNQPIELSNEKISIDRTPGNGAAASTTPATFTQQEIFIPLTQEVPVIQKEIQLAQLVRARKNVETEQSTVSEQIRTERLEVVQNEKVEQSPAQGAPAPAQTGASALIPTGERTFVGEITAADPANHILSVRNWKTGESMTFTFDERPRLTLKENRQPYLIDFKVGYPVRVGYTGPDDGAIAHSMTRVDTPEVK